MSSRRTGAKRKTPSAATAKAAVGAKKPATKTTRKPKGMPNFIAGEILTDLSKKPWRLGPLMGWGGFGALYYASPDVTEDVNDEAIFVAKVEPHSNGPLFGEVHFYQRVGKADMLRNWTSLKKLKSLGIPTYIGAGSYEKDDKKFRFLIMERYGEDVDQLFTKHQRCFHIKTVLTLGIRILDMLEYIHNQGYVHADIKGSNLMMGYVSSHEDQVFLVDYGLVCRYNAGDKHKEYKEERKRKHDGTIEFTSIDAHKGVAPSRRTDLEILGYVMLQWLSSRLPWEDNLKDKEDVMQCKVKYMSNIPKLLKDCGLKSDELQEYLKYTVGLKYDEEPDYNKLRKILQDGLRRRKLTDDGKTVEFLPGEAGPVQIGHSSKERGNANGLGISTDQEENEERLAVRKTRRTGSAGEEPAKKAPVRKSKKKAAESEEKPAKRTRGRPKKVMVDTATSP